MKARLLFEREPTPLRPITESVPGIGVRRTEGIGGSPSYSTTGDTIWLLSVGIRTLYDSRRLLACATIIFAYVVSAPHPNCLPA